MLYSASQKTIAASNLAQFRKCTNQTGDYDSLHAWSVTNREAFWDALWDYSNIIGEKGDVTLEHGDDMLKSRFYPKGRINFAENFLWKKGNSPAIIFRAEDKEASSMTWDELHALVSRLQQAFSKAGLVAGDRVAAMVSNRPESVAAMLAVTSLGAIWSSCSPDFGANGVLDRFSQITPKFFIAVDGYYYAGKTIDVSDKITNVSAVLKAQTLIIPVLQKTGSLTDFIENFKVKPVEFTKMPFNAPVYILFSSGTTGVPKCIVHSGGGVLLKHASELRLHGNIRENDRFFYFTTCGWMMWNWLVSGLTVGATLMLYDGSPFHPTKTVVFDYARDEKFDFLGTSAKYIDSCRKEGLDFTRYDLSNVKTIASTGSPLSAESFRYVYEHVKRDVHLVSVSGGTDLCGSFVGGTLEKPVYAGYIQAKLLGMAVDILEKASDGKGELVCTKSFPSQPIGFFGDPSGEKYFNAYYARFENVWCHGDFAESDAHGYIIHGRSDATLNPGGVRIGTAEIYAVVEQIPEVIEAIAIGQEYDNDTRIVLFVRLREGISLDNALITRIKTQIKTGASPRHVPAVVIAVADIPRTKSGKITELAVRDVVAGREIKNTEALANPESLALFKGLKELF
jgi:acetoacetyl-CoA synthetase